MRRSFSNGHVQRLVHPSDVEEIDVPLIRDSYMHRPLRTGRMSQSSPDAIATGSNVTPLREWIRVGL